LLAATVCGDQQALRSADGPRQKTLCSLGELNSSAQARRVKTIEVFNEQGEARQRKLFPSTVAPPEDDPQVARALVHKVRLERTRSFGSCFLGLELWKRLELDRFFAEHVDCEPADVPWSRVAAARRIWRGYESAKRARALICCAPISPRKQPRPKPPSFRALKSELSVRPLYHQLEPRVRAHIMVAFLGYALWVTLKHLLKRRPPIVPAPSASGVDNAQPMTPMRAIALLSTLQSADIVLPTTDGREIRLRRITEPTTEQKSLLRQFGIRLPEHLRFQRKCSADSAVA